MYGNSATFAGASGQSRRAFVTTLVAVAVMHWTLAANLAAQNPNADSKQQTQPEGPGSIPDPNGATDHAAIEKQNAPAGEQPLTAGTASEPLVPVAVDPSLNGESNGAYGPAGPSPIKPERQLPSARLGVMLNDVPALGLSALDHSVFIQEDEQNPATCKKLRVSVRRDLHLGPDDGRWTTLPGVGQLWMADVVSQGAFGLRIHFTDMNLPAGALLFVYSPTLPGFANGPYQTVGPVGDGQFWAASTEGERARIELFIPDAGAPAKPAAQFRIDAIQHYYRDEFSAAAIANQDDPTPHGGGCHNDVSCHPAWTNVSHSVARMYYVEGTSGYKCTGQLLNPQNGDLTPYFLTANHCISDNAAAQTLQCYWFYQSSTCNGSTPTLGSVPKSLVGTLLSTSAATDYTLIMVEGELPCGVFWNGWTSSAIPNGEASACVHHPDGLPTKISFGTRATAAAGCSSGNPNFMRENWSDGVTEGGSSGSGIYRTSDQRLYGQLFCGPSSCEAGGVTYDDYGAFARTYADNAIVQTLLAGGSDDAFEPNDSCASAITVGEGLYTNRVVKDAQEDWYRINVPAGGTLAVSLAFSDINGDVDVQLFSSCGGSVLASSVGVTDAESFVYNNTGGSTNFLVRVYLAGCDTRNSYNINLSASLPNDACTSATVIPPNSTAYNPSTYSTVAANASGSEPQESCESGNVGVSNTVWYSFTPCGGGTISINTIGSNYDTVLSVFAGSCGLATQVACNDDIVSGNLQSQLTNIPVSGGVTYLIKVADYGSVGGGNLDFNFSYTAAAPTNDLCASAVLIPNGVTTFNPTPYCTIGATNSGGDVVESCGLSPNSNSVWYRFVPCGHGTISVDTNGSDYDTVVSVFFGACGAAIEIACDDDAGTGTNSQLTAVPVAAGVTYLIKISDYNTPDGGTLDFNFTYAPVVPSNDSCGSPDVIPGSPGSYNPLSYCTVGADATLFEPQESCESGNVGVSNSVWYSFTPCASGTISLDTIGSNYDTVLSVHSGVCTGSSQVACDDDAGGNLNSLLVNVPVTRNTMYLIKVADYSTPNGGTLVFHFSFTAGAPIFLGDMNCDGCITTTDVQAMVLALLNPATYAATYPGCNILRGDTNGDSLVNGRDIRGFTNLVLTP